MAAEVRLVQFKRLFNCFYLLVICAFCVKCQAFTVDDIEIYPSGGQIIVEEGSQVVLHCTARSQAPPADMTWYYEISGRGVQRQAGLYNRSLVIDDIRASDAGPYTCKIWDSQSRETSKTVKVFVKAVDDGAVCGTKSFRCNSGHCIFLIFRCDNVNHCPDASDEVGCVDQSCTNGFLCDNGKCIAKELECDVFRSNNCGDWSDEKCTYATTFQHHPVTPSPVVVMTDTALGLQNTVYAIIGITLGIILFFVILIIAICRIRLQRSAQRPLCETRHSHSHETACRHHGHLHYDDRDIISRLHSSSPWCAPCSPIAPNIVLNINSGLQVVPNMNLMPYMASPPPYSEVGSDAGEDAAPPPYSTLDRRRNKQICDEYHMSTGINSRSHNRRNTHELSNVESYALQQMSSNVTSELHNQRNAPELSNTEHPVSSNIRSGLRNQRNTSRMSHDEMSSNRPSESNVLMSNINIQTSDSQDQQQLVADDASDSNSHLLSHIIDQPGQLLLENPVLSGTFSDSCDQENILTVPHTGNHQMSASGQSSQASNREKSINKPLHSLENRDIRSLDITQSTESKDEEMDNATLQASEPLLAESLDQGTINSSVVICVHDGSEADEIESLLESNTETC